MTLAEARANLGAGVVYTPQHGAREDGTIVRVNDAYVFVQYGLSVKATAACDLTFLARPQVQERIAVDAGDQ